MVKKMSSLYFIQMTIVMCGIAFADGQALYENKYIHEMNQYNDENDLMLTQLNNIKDQLSTLRDRDMQRQKQVTDLKDEINSCRGVREEECRRSRPGYDYTGKVNVTQSGRTCQAWILQTPHNHPYTSLPENYCRNPGVTPNPWCYTTDPNKRWDYCVIPYCVTCPLECLRKNDPKGTKYFGTLNVTKTGDPCQRWDSQTPHTHTFGQLYDQENYCRNPNNDDGPWCYTTNADKRQEYCAVPHC